jgi:hypothetical protein
MSRVGLEPTTPAFERAKTVHALDRAATVILTKQALWYEGAWGSGCIDPYFLDLGTSWR